MSDDEYAEATLNRLLDEAAKRFEETLGSDDPAEE